MKKSSLAGAGRKTWIITEWMEAQVLRIGKHGLPTLMTLTITGIFLFLVVE